VDATPIPHDASTRDVLPDAADIASLLSGKWYIRMAEGLNDIASAAVSSPSHIDILKRLGRGGCGSVFLGVDRMTGREVAIKQVAHSNTLQRAQNFREVLLLSEMRHPNIVTYECCHAGNDMLWIVMEYMRGGTLTETVERIRPKECEIAYVAHSLLTCLEYLHRNHFAHRDVKSANVMFSVEGHIKLIDFGLAADLSRSPTHHETCIVGSPFWISPEMVRGIPHTYSTDVLSLGICLLELANGAPPHRDNCLTALIRTGTTGISNPFPRPHKWSASFLDFERQCLRYDARERPPISDLLLHPFIQSKTSQAHMARLLSNAWVQETIIRFM
jgi:serine/threonine protein kinase